MNRQDLRMLIERAKKSQSSMPECSDLLGTYIQDAERLLSQLKENAKLSSAQKEIYKRLEDAVGP